MQQIPWRGFVYKIWRTGEGFIKTTLNSLYAFNQKGMYNAIKLNYSTTKLFVPLVELLYALALADVVANKEVYGN